MTIESVDYRKCKNESTYSNIQIPEKIKKYNRSLYISNILI